MRKKKNTITVSLKNTKKVGPETFGLYKDEVIWTNPHFDAPIQDKDYIYSFPRHNIHTLFWNKGRVSAHCYMTVAELEKMARQARAQANRFKRAAKKKKNPYPKGPFLMHFGNITICFPE